MIKSTIARILRIPEDHKGQIIRLLGIVIPDPNNPQNFRIEDGTGSLSSCFVRSDRTDILRRIQLLDPESLVEVHGVLSDRREADGATPADEPVLEVSELFEVVSIQDAFEFGRRKLQPLVRFDGWTYNKRSSGKIQFIEVRDGTGICQCVMSKRDVDPIEWEKAESLGQESNVEVYGKLVPSEKAPGGFELQLRSLSFNAFPASDLQYPITPKEHGIEYLMSHRHLWLRSTRPWAIMRIRHTLIDAIRSFFNSRGFILFDAPILTPAACEGTSTLFETEYFEEGPAYLSQSGQLYGEAGAMAFGKVYVFGPTFRAEKSKTKRHLTEFWMVEPEVAYMDLEGDMQLAEEFIHDVIGRVLRDCQRELAVLDEGTGRLAARASKVLQPFKRLHYDEAADILDEFWKKKLEAVSRGEEQLPPTAKPFQRGDDFGTYDEVALTSIYEQPVIVHHYPSAVKAFYMKRDPNEPDKALAMDVLFPEFGEIIGGSQREDDYDTLVKRLEEHDLPREAFEWYLDLRRYGSVPHAGFGLGLERLITWVCDLEHIREAIPFARTLNRIWP